MIEIPLSTDARQSFTTDLGSRRMAMEVAYNERSGLWIASIADEVSGEVLAGSIALVTGVDLLAPYNLDLGHLYMVDQGAGAPRDASLETLGNEVVMVWLDAAEHAELAA